MDKIYPVQILSTTPRRVLFEDLESRLNKWLIELPEDLRYPSNDRNANVLPHVLILHIEYYAAVLLLHRALYVYVALPPILLIAQLPSDRKSTRLNSSHSGESRMPSSA